MAYKIRTRVCSVCGRVMHGRYPPFKPVKCIDCAVNVMEANSMQMASKTGDGYSKWLTSAGPRGRPRK